MKKRSQFIKLLSLLITIFIMTTQLAKAQDSASIKMVNNTVEKLTKAMIDADSVTLDKLTYNELSYGHSSGNIQDKKQFIQGFTSHSSVFVKIDLSNQTTTVMGDVAIVRHTLFAETNDKGKGPGSVKLGIILVWKKNHNGEWMLLARQAVKLNS